MFDIDIKALLGIAGVLCVLVAYFPYLRDMFKHQTTPHAYTWLIWLLTQGTASAAMLYSGAGWGSAPFVFGTLLVFAVFLLCFRFGTSNITKSDGVILALALLAIIVWWQLDNPLIAVIMVSAIDASGYIPTYRKLWTEPWSETLSSWCLFIASSPLGILALSEFSLTTVLYGATLTVANIILVTLALYRRQTIPKP